MKQLLILLILIFYVAVLRGTERIGVPGGIGDGDSLLPFGLQTLGVDSVRYQQVYSADPFAIVSSSGLWILEIRFVDQVGFRFAEIPMFQINLSTTLRGLDELSSNFSENVGPDETVAFGPGSHFFVRSSQETFGTSLPLNQPFFFNPSEGNLLLDIRNYSPEISEVPPFDYWRPHRTADQLGDGVSSVYALDVNATMGTTDTEGLLTLFVVQVPEPSTWALFILAGILVVYFRLPKKAKATVHNKRDHHPVKP